VHDSKKSTIRQSFKYTNKFRGRVVPIWLRVALFGRAIVLSPLIFIEFRSLVGEKRSRSRFAQKLINDIGNSTLGNGLDIANRMICLLKRRKTTEFDKKFELTPMVQEISKTVTTDLEEMGFSQVHRFISSAEAGHLFEKISRMPGYCKFKGSYLTQKHWLEDLSGGPRFDVDNALVVGLEEFTRISKNPLLLAISRSYLGCPPLLASMQVWSTRRPQIFDLDVLDESAMAFHCDSDYFGFLKFFLLLTEVDFNNGPFTFVSKSHRGSRHNVGRMSDSEIVSSGDDLHFGIGRPGDLIIADTKGWHKATPPQSGVRTMLQIVYASSLFGPLK